MLLITSDNIALKFSTLNPKKNKRQTFSVSVAIAPLYQKQHCMLEGYQLPPDRRCDNINIVTLRVQFRSRKIQFEIFGKRYGLEVGSIPSTSIFSCQIHSINAQNSPSPHYYKIES
jgi:hypothetical protein